jgi:hypothetical protein
VICPKCGELLCDACGLHATECECVSEYDEFERYDTPGFGTFDADELGIDPEEGLDYA